MQLVILPLILDSPLLDILVDMAKYWQRLMYYTQSHQQLKVVFPQHLTILLSHDLQS